MNKVYVVDGSGFEDRMWSSFITEVNEASGGDFWEQTENIAEASVLIFTGGSDISPSLYKEKKLPCTHNNYERDKFEAAVFKEFASKPPVKMVGICRGAQFLCAMSGGRVWQDVNNHLGNHTVVLPDGTTTEVTSTHHQMMRIGEDHRVLASAFLSTKRVSEAATYISGVHEDPEVLVHKSKRILMFQPHPEIGHKPTFDLFVSCLKELYKQKKEHH